MDKPTLKFNFYFLFFVLIFLQACRNDADPIEPMVIGPPKIEQLNISRDTVLQDQVGLPANSIISFNYINEFGNLGAPTNLDTLVLTITDLRFDSQLHPFLLYNGLNNQFAYLINGRAAFKPQGTCCVIDNMACEVWPDTFQEVPYSFFIINQNGESSDTLQFSLVVDCRV